MAKEENVSAEQTVRDIRRQTRRKYNTEEKIRIVLEGLGGEASVAVKAGEPRNPVSGTGLKSKIYEIAL